MSQAERVMARWARITALGTFVSAVAICLQWYEMHTGGEDTKSIAEAAKQQACAAQRFADSAANINHGVSDAVTKLDVQTQKMDEARTESTRVSEQILRSEERAYVAVSDIKPPEAGPIVRPQQKGSSIVSTQWCARVEFSNTGRTPAIGERSTVEITSGPDAEKTVRNFKVPPYPYSSGNIVTQTLSKTGCIRIDPALPIPGFYVYGVVQYRDVFGEYHETGFCDVITHYPQGQKHGCGFGNWFDHQSKDYPKGPDYPE